MPQPQDTNKNVLYITFEMQKKESQKDINLFDVTIDDLHAMPKDMYDNKVSKLQKKTISQLIIKEYPTALLSKVGSGITLLNELSLKKNFKPDVVFIDYLNICARVVDLEAVISHHIFTSTLQLLIELSALAVEFDVPIFSATQTTRSAFYFNRYRKFRRYCRIIWCSHHGRLYVCRII